jgi:RNA polymerase sigma factor (sigma-70 family)
MASHPLQDFIRRLRRARSVAEGDHLTDAQLLERFNRQRDEAAFEVLVWRHGTLVLNVARRVLRHVPDIEDVFQATFLTLARKASAIRRGTSLSSWLYKVAYRLALRVREAAARSQRQEQFEIENAAAPAEHGDAELAIVLAEEVNRLPERYRAVVVLCYLQGVTTEEAARMLGCPRGTVLSRLSSARQRLRQRLLRRGIAPAVALAAVSFGETASAAPSVALVTCVVRAALPFAAGGAAVPMESSQAAALAQGALQTMFWNKIKIVTVMVCMIALVGTGSGWLARSRSAAEASNPAAEPQAPKDAPIEVAPQGLGKTKDEIDKIHKEMAILAAKEQDEERMLSEAAVDARLELLELQEELEWRAQMLELGRQQTRDKIKETRPEVTQLEKNIREFEQKAPREIAHPAVTSMKARKKELEDKLEKLESDESRGYVQFRQQMKDTRRAKIGAEEKVRSIELRQSRQREYFASQRERMQRRLEQLEDKTLDLRPADGLRDVERKLDALRREVGELRRALDRKGNDPRQKP